MQRLCCRLYTEARRDLRWVVLIHGERPITNYFPGCNHCQTNQIWLCYRDLTHPFSILRILADLMELQLATKSQIQLYQVSQ